MICGNRHNNAKHSMHLAVSKKGLLLINLVYLIMCAMFIVFMVIIAITVIIFIVIVVIIVMLITVVIVIVIIVIITIVIVGLIVFTVIIVVVFIRLCPIMMLNIVFNVIIFRHVHSYRIYWRSNGGRCLLNFAIWLVRIIIITFVIRSNIINFIWLNWGVSNSAWLIIWRFNRRAIRIVKCVGYSIWISSCPEIRW